MLINKANLAALNVTLNGAFQKAFEKAESYSEKIRSDVMAPGLVGLYPFANLTGGLRKWVGPRMSLAAQAHTYTLPHQKFEQTLVIPRSDIVRDNLGVFTSMLLPQMGDAVKKHPDTEIATAVFDANPTGFDSVAFWSGSHKTYRTATETYTNDFEIDATSIEVLGNELARMRAGMMTIRGQDGLLLSTNHRLLVTPVAQEMLFRKVLFSSTIPGDNGAPIDNPMKGMFDILVVPELDLIDPTVFYTMDVSRPVKPILWQKGSNPIFRAFTDQPDNLHAFMHDEYVWGIDGDNGAAYEANAGVTLPFLSARGTLSLPT